MNRERTLRRQEKSGWICFIALALLLQFSGYVAAQGVLTGSQTGVVQDLLGNGPLQLTISGVIYTYDDETVFTLRGEEISDSDLEIGMVLRFTHDDGVLEQVQVLGPNNLIENFHSH